MNILVEGSHVAHHHFERIKWLTATHAQRRPSGLSLSLLFLRSNVSKKALPNSIPAVQRQGKLESNPGESSNVVHLQTNELESFVFNATAAAAAQKKFQVSFYEENERENRERSSMMYSAVESILKPSEEADFNI